MEEVEVKFEREGLAGIVPVGTYLVDAAKRLGVKLEGECSQSESLHFCSMTVKSGADLLSPETNAETEHFSKEERKPNERLACQAKIEKPGEIVVLTEENKKEEETMDTSEQYIKEFSELPLEKQIANLMRLEAIALGETFSFVMNSPYTIAGKIMDVMAEFGFKKEEQAKKAARPEENAEAEPVVVDKVSEADEVIDAEEKPTDEKTTTPE